VYLTKVRRTFGKHLEVTGDPLENAQRELDIASPYLYLHQNGSIGGWAKNGLKECQARRIFPLAQGSISTVVEIK
jgi:hypothetical protein